MSRRKTCREKLADDKGLPKVVPITGNIRFLVAEHEHALAKGLTR
jgi:hypothetical protein